MSYRDFASARRVVFGNGFDQIAMLLPGILQPPRIMQRYGTETRQHFPQVVDDLAQAIIAAGRIQNLMKFNIRLDNAVNFPVFDVIADFHEQAFEFFEFFLRDAFRRQTSSSRTASRIGVRETPSSSANCSSIKRSPGCKVPF